MTKILVVIGLAAAALTLLGLFVNQMYPVSTLHYRLDVTFEVDSKQVTGSGVHRLHTKRLRGLSQKMFLLTASGEAVIVDLPDRKSVFVLLTSPTPDGTYTGGVKGRYDFLLADACGLWEKRDELGPSGFVRFLGTVTGTCAVPEEELPLMVAFGDEADPTSVERVFPGDPEPVLGPGVRFVGASVTVTDAPVTTGIADRLTWLSEYPEPGLDSQDRSSTSRLARILKHGYFRRPSRD
ncbi:MAG: hypothetical protein JJ902_05735 [Roseibium sp.]|nr:hypothetical protein [Roseibium sp.]